MLTFVDACVKGVGGKVQEVEEHGAPEVFLKKNGGRTCDFLPTNTDVLLLG